MKRNSDEFFIKIEAEVYVIRYENMKKNNLKHYFDIFEFELIIDYYVYEDKVKEAFEAVELACAQHPNSMELEMKKAQVFLKKGQAVNALNFLNQIEEIRGKEANIFIMKATSYEMLGDDKNAIKEFDNAIESVGHSEKNLILYTIGMFFQLMGKYEISIDYFEKAHEHNNTDLDTIYEMAFTYEKIDRNDESIFFYKMYLEEEPFSKEAWLEIGVIYFKKSEYKKALESYDFAITNDENYSDAYFNKGNTFAEMEKFGEAIKMYKHFLKLEKNENAMAYSYIGSCYKDMKDFKNAEKYYKKSLKIEGDLEEALFGMAYIKFLKSKFLESLFYMKRIINFNKKDTRFYYFLGKIYIELKIFEEAFMSLKKTIKLDHYYVDAWLEYANLFYENGQVFNAINVLKDALSFNIKNAEINYRISEYFFVVKNKEEAYKFFENAIALNFKKHINFSFKKKPYFRYLISKYKKSNEEWIN